MDSTGPPPVGFTHGRWLTPYDSVSPEKRPLVSADSGVDGSSPSNGDCKSGHYVLQDSTESTWKRHMSLRRCKSWVFLALLAVYLFFLTSSPTAPAREADPVRRSNGYSDIVQWDNYTLWIHNQRIFLHSGEFHTFRLPVRELWLDIFQKMVAAGLNGVSIYVHMGLTNPSRGVVDFKDWRALKPMYNAASEAGLFIVLRPGPYINAETSAGGIAHWITTETAGEVRTNATDWVEAYEPYIDGVIKESVDYQITNGGPIIAVQIDNEYDQSISHQLYFQRLENQYREGSIVVPLTYNDPNEREAFINGTGAVDIYGMDAYPQAFDCSNPLVWKNVSMNYHAYHENVNPSQPWYMPEFQAGAFDPWAGPGYEACAVLTGPDFEDVFYKHNWAANEKLVNYYMIYGGTNWGGIPFPGVYTSYDYGAPIRENRLLTDKYDEVKRQGIFLRSSPEFRKTDWIGDSASGIPEVTIDNGLVYGTYLRNPDTGTGFLITRQNDSTSAANVAFTVSLPTSQGILTLPTTADSIVLHGRQSKLITTDYTFGTKGALLYTTTSIFFAGTIGPRDVIFLYGHVGQSHEFSFIPLGDGVGTTSSLVQLSKLARRPATTVTILPGVQGLITVWESPEQLVLYSDPVTAATFWAPPIRSPSVDIIEGLETFWQFGTNTTVLVGGPYLVRNASLEDSGTTLALVGDLNASVPLTVFAPQEVTAVTWNGEPVGTMTQSRSSGLRGMLVLKSGIRDVKVPELTGWRYADSLPEVKKGYDDTEWVVADKKSTNIPIKPVFGDGRVLYGCDYGFCENIVLWRGHFNATGLETGANLTIYGGECFAASVWINDKFISSVYSPSEHVNHLFKFPEDALIVGEDNVMTVIQDNMGLDEDDNEKSARGIAGFALVGGNTTFGTWKVQGKVGGYLNYPDKVRGLFNEGGLHGERKGWHLPGFDTSGPEWTLRELSDGLPGGSAGVGFFVTTFELDIPGFTDTPISFQFEETNDQPYRALLFVNGWQYGKRAANIGPQTRFTVPQGILDYTGENWVAIALWALNDTAVSPTLQLAVDAIIEGGVGPIASKNPVWRSLRP
ncbi:glycoside hydrolase superfamily [Dichomitus squalens]|nr:glycoside hydrolase superfamily [Dichomitus squalens]